MKKKFALYFEKKLDTSQNRAELTPDLVLWHKQPGLLAGGEKHDWVRHGVFRWPPCVVTAGRRGTQDRCDGKQLVSN